MTPLVVADAPHQFLHPRQNVVVDANPVPRIVSRQSHHAFDDVVVRRRCAYLCGRRRIVDQRVEGFRQLLVEDLPIGGQVVEEDLHVVGDADGVEPQPEHLRVFGLLERELRQVHLVAEAPLSPHRRHERLDVLGDGLLARDELRAQPGGPFAFQIGERFPVLSVLREVDVGGVPELGVAAGKQLERQAVPVQAARGE